MNELDKTIEESCKYDRAYVRVQQIIGDLKEQKKDGDEIALESGEWPDTSFDIVIQDLQMICNVYNEESKRLWNLAEKNGEYKQENVENLCNAIVQKAVEDYEIAISGAGNPSEKLL